jgi:hypothetical protein
VVMLQLRPLPPPGAFYTTPISILIFVDARFARVALFHLSPLDFRMLLSPSLPPPPPLPPHRSMNESFVPGNSHIAKATCANYRTP